MEQTGSNINRKKAIDFEFLIREILKALYFIMCVVIIIGVFVYIWQDKHNKTTYEATMILVVVPRDNVANRQQDSAIDMAATRCVNVLNSNSLRDQMRKENTGVNLSGSFMAEVVENTNMIRMVATSDTSRDALRMLRAGLNAYSSVASYMESGYLLRRLSDVSAENIVAKESRASFQAIVVMFVLALAGIGIVVFRGLITDIIHNKEQAGDLIDVPIIGTLPFVKKKGGKKAILSNQEDIDLAYVENIDRIVTSLQEQMSEDGKKVILVTSISENEGKTTVVGNIALNLATRGYKVSLVDGDFRRPAIVKLLQQNDEAKADIYDIIKHNKKIEEAAISYEEDLKLYLQKERVTEPDKLLETEEFVLFIEKLKAESDYVIIDTPPLGIIRDAEIIAKNADKALLVFCQDQTHATDINDAVDLLENAGTTVLGAIMNKTKKLIFMSRSGSYSNYYYYYGYSRKKGKRG